MNSFVVDASVAVKWVVPEIHFEAARRLLGKGYGLQVPDFFFAEVSNVFWKRVKRGEGSAEDARIALEALSTQPFKVSASQGLMARALDMALQTQRTVYDCVYLTLAVERQCQMATADQKLFNALQQDPLAAYLCWVENLP